MAFSTDMLKAEKIAKKIGFAETLMLCAWFGGRQIWVPTTTRDVDHILAKIIGAEGFAALVEGYPGQLLNVPECDLEPLKIAGLVVRLTQKGVSAPDIAQLCGISARQVYIVRKQLRLEGFPEIADLLPDSEVAEVPA